MVSKDDLVAYLGELGIEIKDGSIRRSDCDLLLDSGSGLSVASVEMLNHTIEPGKIIYRVRVTMLEGDRDRYEDVFNSNKAMVEQKLHVLGQYSGLNCERAELSIANYNDANVWLDVCFYLDPDSVMSEEKMGTVLKMLFEM